jgi:hypothetical protein
VRNMQESEIPRVEMQKSRGLHTHDCHCLHCSKAIDNKCISRERISKVLLNCRANSSVLQVKSFKGKEICKSGECLKPRINVFHQVRYPLKSIQDIEISLATIVGNQDILLGSILNQRFVSSVLCPAITCLNARLGSLFNQWLLIWVVQERD